MEAGRVGRNAATAEVVVRRRGGIAGANGGNARHIVASEGDIGGESVGADGLTADVTLTCNYVTGIAPVRTGDSASSSHYDLSGRRIAPNAPGLHVLKGSKLIVR